MFATLAVNVFRAGVVVVVAAAVVIVPVVYDSFEAVGWSGFVMLAWKFFCLLFFLVLVLRGLYLLTSASLLWCTYRNMPLQIPLEEIPGTLRILL